MSVHKGSRMARRIGQAGQRGFALITALIFLLLLTLLGTSSMSGALLQERMAGNLRDRNIAFQSAEAALREGEAFLSQPALPAFDGSNGLLTHQPLGGLPMFWRDSWDWENNSRTGAPVAGTVAAPRFVIERLPAIPAMGDSARFGPISGTEAYRITARAEGGSPDAVVILQVNYIR